MARVLILDDDLGALAFARQAVRAAGHDASAVTSAADARAALAAPSPPDVLIVAPGADAGEALTLVSQLWSERPASRAALFLLGDGGPRAPPVARIPVPVTAAALAARIAEALAGRPSLRAGGRRAADHEARAGGPPLEGESALRALFRRPHDPVSGPARAAAGAPPDAARPRDITAAPGGGDRRGAVRLEELAALARSADYFQVLGVPRSTTATEVREAADRLLAELDLAQLGSPRVVSGLELADVRQVVIDARDVLGDDARREAYQRGIAGPPPRPAGGTRPNVANDDRS